MAAAKAAARDLFLDIARILGWLSCARAAREGRMEGMEHGSLKAAVRRDPDV